LVLAGANSNQLAAKWNVFSRAHFGPFFGFLYRRTPPEEARHASRRTGKEWQDKFRLPEHIPVKIAGSLSNVRMRVRDGDSASFLEADLQAIRASNRNGNAL
jgi:hypothetical protein